MATREAIVARRQAGGSLPQIATELGVPWATVRRVWRRDRERGDAGLTPDYAACGRHGSRYPAVYDQALTLRRDHPGWGAGLIRVLLAKTFPDQPLPHERTLRRWFREAGLGPPPPRPRSPGPLRAHQPHARWQLDATEQIVLADGTRASWLAASDEATGGMLGAVVFPPRPLEPGRSA
jgi:transposase